MELAIPFWVLVALFVKNDTVNGIIGNTQGVNKAINPPRNPNKKIVTLLFSLTSSFSYVSQPVTPMLRASDIS